MSDPSGAQEKETSPPVEPDDALLREGLEALKEGHFEEAAEFFGEILEERVEKHGGKNRLPICDGSDTTCGVELAIECALPGYYYGLSLLHVAQSSKEIFAENEDATGDDAEPPDDNTADLAIAWETLECARHNFESSASPVPHHSQLTDVHIALGDVASETSNFESALTEYRKAVSHLEQCTDAEGMSHDRSGGTQRRFCEIYYKMCLSWEFLDDLKEASVCCDKAIDAIRLEMASLGDTSESSAELKEIEKDLIERKEAIEISKRETDQVKDSLREMLQQRLPEMHEKKEEVPVDLGIVGRGKQRIHVHEKTDAENVSKLEVASPVSRKRATDPNEHEVTLSGKKTKTDDDSHVDT